MKGENQEKTKEKKPGGKDEGEGGEPLDKGSLAAFQLEKGHGLLAPFQMKK